MLVGNIADELGISTHTVYKVLRESDSYSAEGVIYRRYVKHHYRKARLVKLTEDIFDSQLGDTTVKDVQRLLFQKHDYSLSYSRVRAIIKKDLGYRWRTVSP